MKSDLKSLKWEGASALVCSRKQKPSPSPLPNLKLNGLDSTYLGSDIVCKDIKTLTSQREGLFFGKISNKFIAHIYGKAIAQCSDQIKHLYDPDLVQLQVLSDDDKKDVIVIKFSTGLKQSAVSNCRKHSVKLSTVPARMQWSKMQLSSMDCRAGWTHWAVSDRGCLVRTKEHLQQQQQTVEPRMHRESANLQNHRFKQFGTIDALLESPIYTLPHLSEEHFKVHNHSNMQDNFNSIHAHIILVASYLAFSLLLEVRFKLLKLKPNHSWKWRKAPFAMALVHYSYSLFVKPSALLSDSSLLAPSLRSDAPRPSRPAPFQLQARASAPAWAWCRS